MSVNEVMPALRYWQDSLSEACPDTQRVSLVNQAELTTTIIVQINVTAVRFRIIRQNASSNACPSTIRGHPHSATYNCIKEHGTRPHRQAIASTGRCRHTRIHKMKAATQTLKYM